MRPAHLFRPFSLRIFDNVRLFPSALGQHLRVDEPAGRDDAAAADEGWDKGQVWEAIKQVAQQHSLPSNDFQEWEKAWKNNDILFGVTNVTVETVHMWAQELDGTVSRYIVRFDGAGHWTSTQSHLP